MPQVTVIMPVFNAARYLMEAIESVRSQQEVDLELIVLNDGSADESAEIARRASSNDRRIVFIDGAHRGVVYQRNRGISMAQSELLALMDADDISLPTRLAKQVRFMTAHTDCVAAGSSATRIDESGLAIDHWDAPLAHEEIVRRHLAGMAGAMINPTVILRKAAAEKVGVYRHDFEIAEDYDLFLRLAEVGRLANLPETLLKYRLHAKSLTFARAERQRTMTRLALADAWRRRGLPGTPPASPLEIRAISEEELMWDWARSAFAARNYPAARNQSKKLVRRRPFDPRCWALYAAALSGPFGQNLKRVIPYRVGAYEPTLPDRSDSQTVVPE